MLWLIGLCALVAAIGGLWMLYILLQSSSSRLWLLGFVFLPIYFVPLFATRDIRNRLVPLLLYLGGLLGIVLLALFS